jgi:2-dehydro-3-deoxygluconokinase
VHYIYILFASHQFSTMQKVLTFGEIMLRLSTPGYERFTQARQFEVRFGGGEANVAVSLANFGIPVKYVTRLPKNDIGQACLMELKRYGLDVDAVSRGGERMGIYFLETGAVARASQVIYDRAGSSMAALQPGMIDWKTVFEGVTWFHWTGITPALSEGPALACGEAVQMANKLGITVSTDLNFRKNLWKYGKTASQVMPDLVAGCDLILGNEEDAEKVFGIKPLVADDHHKHPEAQAYESVCRQMMTRFPKARKVIITLRGSISANHNTWSGVLWDGKTLFQAPEYDITHIVDRVGGGDSFMAGLIYGLLTFPGNDQKALDFAAAASCLKHTIPGDFNLVSVEEVERLMQGDASGRVIR